MLAVEHLNLAIGNTVVCQDLSFELSSGKTLVILGGNGVGKSTLLSCLCGHLAPHGKMSGSILWRLPEEIANAAMAGKNDQIRVVNAGQQISAPIQSAHTSPPTMLPTTVPTTMLANSPKNNGQTLAQIGHKQRAKLCGYLAQRSQFLGTVLETVLSGRHPHLLRWQWESSTDFALASAALSLVGLSNYEQRDSQTLSGGEQQRLAIATLLTQAPACLFLDEPLTHLDIYHEFLIMELLCNGQHGVTESLSSLSAAMTATIVAATKLMVLHQPGLAARYADEVILMFGGGDVIVGPAAELLTAENISRLYDYPMVHVADDAGAWFIPGQTQPYPFKPQRGAMR